jgi:hypothetical protein
MGWPPSRSSIGTVAVHRNKEPPLERCVGNALEDGLKTGDWFVGYFIDPGISGIRQTSGFEVQWRVCHIGERRPNPPTQRKARRGSSSCQVDVGSPSTTARCCCRNPATIRSGTVPPNTPGLPRRTGGGHISESIHHLGAGPLHHAQSWRPSGIPLVAAIGRS